MDEDDTIKRSILLIASAIAGQCGLLKLHGSATGNDSQEDVWPPQLLPHMAEGLTTRHSCSGMVAASVACTQMQGCFVEVGKRDIWSPQRVAQERPDLVYRLVAIDFWTPEVVGQNMTRLAAMLSKGGRLVTEDAQVTRDNPTVQFLFIPPELTGCPKASCCQGQLSILKDKRPLPLRVEGIPQKHMWSWLLTIPHAEAGFDWLAGLLKPLPAVVFPLQEAADALRQLSTAKHIGKVVARVRSQLPAPEGAPTGSWIISGGLGALGSLSVKWLASQGARFYPYTICPQDWISLLKCQLIHPSHAVLKGGHDVDLDALFLLRDTVQMAGIRHINVLGRSGHFEAGSDLAHAMRDGWVANVTLIKCDVAFSEDTAVVFSRSQSKGKHAAYDHLRPFLGLVSISGHR